MSSCPPAQAEAPQLLLGCLAVATRRQAGCCSLQFQLFSKVGLPIDNGLVVHMGMIGRSNHGSPASQLLTINYND